MPESGHTSPTSAEKGTLNNSWTLSDVVYVDQYQIYKNKRSEPHLGPLPGSFGLVLGGPGLATEKPNRPNNGSL